MKIITLKSPEGRGIMDFIKSRLEIPENVVGFDLVFRPNQLITITNMTYYPASKRDENQRKGNG